MIVFKRAILCFLFVLLVFNSNIFAETVTKPIEDPVLHEEPCTGGSKASISECNRAGIVCLNGQTCYRATRNSWSGGTESFGFCYHCDGDGGGSTIGGECTSGGVQYRPNPLNFCNTQERRCCGEKFSTKWSAWGKDCVDDTEDSDCSFNECWDGSSCVAKPFGDSCTCANGKCSRSYTCSAFGLGWQSSETCTCNKGFVKKNNICVKEGCNLTCGGSEFLESKSDGSCACCGIGCYYVRGGSNISRCYCTTAQINYTSTCCTGTAGTYRLPAAAAGCTAVDSATGGRPSIEGACSIDYL